MISYLTCVNSNIELRYLIFAIRFIAGKRSKSGMHVSVPIVRVYDIWYYIFSTKVTLRL